MDVTEHGEEKKILKICMMPNLEMSLTNIVFYNKADFDVDECYILVHSRFRTIFLARPSVLVSPGSLSLNKIHRIYSKCSKNGNRECQVMNCESITELEKCVFSVRYKNERRFVPEIDCGELSEKLKSVRNHIFRKGQHLGFFYKDKLTMLEIDFDEYSEFARFTSNTEVFFKIAKNSKARFSDDNSEMILVDTPSHGETNVERRKKIDLNNFDRKWELVSQTCDIEIILSNRSLRLWKPLFIQSSIMKELESISSYEIPELELDINERGILQIMLGIHSSDADVNNENIVDYYTFFRTLQIPQGQEHSFSWLRVTRKMFNSIMTIEQVFKNLHACVMRFENETTQKIFRGEIKMEEDWRCDEHFFESIFCLELLREMVWRRKSSFLEYKPEKSELRYREDVEFQKSVGIMKDILKKCRSTGTYNLHKEILGSKKSVQYRLLETGSFSDLIIVSSDGVQFRCHKFIVLLRSDFIHRMVSFGGSETEEFNSSNTLRLINIDSSVLRIFLRYCYSRSELFFAEGKTEDKDNDCFLVINTESFELIIKCLIFSDRCLEKGFSEYLIERLTFLLSQEKVCQSGLEEGNKDNSREKTFVRDISEFRRAVISFGDILRDTDGLRKRICEVLYKTKRTELLEVIVRDIVLNWIENEKMEED